jgi:hypothetical protein
MKLQTNLQITTPFLGKQNFQNPFSFFIFATQGGPQKKKKNPIRNPCTTYIPP